jgi:hypothetical protein
MPDDPPHKLPPIWSALTFQEILDHCRAAYDGGDEALRRAMIEAKKSPQIKKDTK